eukprot:Partr_v1_DN25186_c1_g1_i5_m76782 putative pyrroline-5-carboxylate reductase
MSEQIDLNTVVIGVIGCGRMGQAIIGGLLASSSIMPGNVICSVGSEDSVAELEKIFPAEVRVVYGDDGNLQVSAEADIVLLCTKPQMAISVFEKDNIRNALESKLVISICAGLFTRQIRDWLPHSSIIRAMPNTACRVQAGMTVFCVSSDSSRVTRDQRNLALKIFSPLGRCRFIGEHLMDAATGLAGSGPAFACVVMESLADGGVMEGMPRDVAIELAAQAVLGAAQLVLTTKKHPAVIKDDVTTPAGCTIAGLLVMEDGKIRSTLARAVQEATKVASVLGKPKPKQQ